MNLLKLDDTWSSRCPSAVAGWRNNWAHLSTFFSFPAEVRKMIYTTNAIEALHRQYRKVTKTKGSFRSKRGWPVMLGQLRIVFGDRIQENAI